MVMRIRSGAAHWLLAACLAAALSGCSLLRFGYGHFDTVAAWMADDYFDLDPQQKDEFARHFARLHDWHRQKQLPDYAAFLREMRARVERGLQRDDILWLREGVRQRSRTLARHAAPDAAALLLTVTTPQLEVLQRQFDKDNRKFARERRLDGTAREQQRASTERLLDQFRTWVGPLTHEQEERMTALIATLPAIDPLVLKDRQRRQREFLQLMEQRGDPAAFRKRLQHWLTYWDEGRAPEYVRSLAEWWEKRAEHIVTLDRTLTPQQRAHVLRRLQNHIDDFTRLAESRRAAAAPQ